MGQIQPTFLRLQTRIKQQDAQSEKNETSKQPKRILTLKDHGKLNKDRANESRSENQVSRNAVCVSLLSLYFLYCSRHVDTL